MECDCTHTNALAVFIMIHATDRTILEVSEAAIFREYVLGTVSIRRKSLKQLVTATSS